MSDADDNFKKVENCTLEGGSKKSELKDFHERDKNNYSVFSALHFRQTREPIEINIEDKQEFLHMDNQEAL